MSVSEKKVAFITGASAGIGRSLALRFARGGYNLILTARRMEKLEETMQECAKYGADCEILVMDMEETGTIGTRALRATDKFGRLDVLVNNAGISQRGSASETDMKVLRKLIEVNFFSTVEVTMALLPKIKSANGSIAIISSMSGLFGFHGRSGYSASKFALHGYFETLAVEEKEISVTLVCPGRVKTEISLNALSVDGTVHGKMDKGQLEGIDLEYCAKKIYEGIEKKKALVIIAKGEKFLYWIKKISLPLFYRVAKKIKTE